MASKAELIRFLDSKVFNPILRAKKENYKESDRKLLEDVQQATESEKKRYRGYRNAGDIRDNYMSDLHSEAAKKINRELKKLRLPRLPDFRDEFLAIADDKRKMSGGKTRTAGGG